MAKALRRGQGRGGGAKAVGRGQGRGEWPMPYGA